LSCFKFDTSCLRFFLVAFLLYWIPGPSVTVKMFFAVVELCAFADLNYIFYRNRYVLTWYSNIFFSIEFRAYNVLIQKHADTDMLLSQPRFDA